LWQSSSRGWRNESREPQVVVLAATAGRESALAAGWLPGVSTTPCAHYRAAEQADAADEAQGGTRTAGQGAALCPRWPDGRGHRFAADPRCSADKQRRVVYSGCAHRRRPRRSATSPTVLRAPQRSGLLGSPRPCRQGEAWRSRTGSWSPVCSTRRTSDGAGCTHASFRRAGVYC
jgi:hypothetical protein